MPVDLILKNLKIYTHGNIIQAGLAINNQKIVKIAKDTNLPSSSKKFDLKGLLILPGLIDTHVHLRDQKLDYKEDFFTGTSAAAIGGISLVIDMPNNNPITMDLTTLKERMSLASRKTIVNIAFYSAFPNKIEEMHKIVKAGAKAFKLYMNEQIGGINISNEQSLIKVFKECSKLDIPIAVHAEDKSFIESKLKHMKKNKMDNMDAYLKVHHQDAEVKAISHLIEITKKTGVYTHICHISTYRGISLVVAAKKKGIPITCEVTPHHLLLSSSHLNTLGPIALTNPPLRSFKEKHSLMNVLNKGIINNIVSDHAPHHIREKKRDSIWKVAPGIPGLETLLPLMLTEVNKGHLSLSRLVKMTSEGPAETFRLKDRGILEEGGYADLVVVDMKKKWKIDSAKFHSKANFSPFDGWYVKGKPIKTFVNGQLVMDNEEIFAKAGDGKIIK